MPDWFRIKHFKRKDGERTSWFEIQVLRQTISHFYRMINGINGRFERDREGEKRNRRAVWYRSGWSKKWIWHDSFAEMQMMTMMMTYDSRKKKMAEPLVERKGLVKAMLAHKGTGRANGRKGKTNLDEMAACGNQPENKWRLNFSRNRQNVIFKSSKTFLCCSLNGRILLEEKLTHFGLQTWKEMKHQMKGRPFSLTPARNFLLSHVDVIC